MLSSWRCQANLQLHSPPRDAALDDLLCSVFHSPNVARIVANKLGFQYLSETAVEEDLKNVKGILYGMTFRAVVPMSVEDFSVVQPAGLGPLRLKIVMLYDTGSSLTYLTREVLTSLGFEVQQDESLTCGAALQTFSVKLNGQALEVGVSPKERCEHVCLLGQNYMFDNKLRAVIDYQSQIVSITTP